MLTLEQVQAGQTELLPGDARRLTERIRLIAGAVADNMQKLRELVDQARSGNAHAVLGYASWTAYITDLFGDEPLRLARDVRQELVAELASQGMSTRAIAPIVGVDNKTVHRDIAAVANATPAPAPLDPPMVVDEATGEILDDEPEQVTATEHTETVKTKTVTGLDGKTYQKATPSEPRRKSITDEAYKANLALFAAVERIRSIADDDRYARNKADILAALQPSIGLALETLPGLTAIERN